MSGDANAIKTQGNKNTHYVGKGYEYIDNGNGTSTHRQLIYAGGKVVAINTETYEPDNAIPIANQIPALWLSTA